MPDNIVSLAFEITANPEQAAAALKAIQEQALATSGQLNATLESLAKSQEAAAKSLGAFVQGDEKEIEKLVASLRAVGIQINRTKQMADDARPALAQLLESAAVRGESKASFIQGYEESLQKAHQLSQQAANNLGINQLINKALSDQKAILAGIQEKNAVVLKMEEGRMKAEQVSAENIAKLAELDQASKVKAIQQLEEGRRSNEPSTRSALNQYERNKTINAAPAEQASLLKGIQEKKSVVLGLEEVRAKAERASD